MMQIDINEMLVEILKNDFNNLVRTLVPTRLLKILKGDIIIEDECYSFYRFPAGYSEELHDKTGNECFNNKFYIDDFCYRKNPKDYIKVGFSFCMLLGEKLKQFNEPFCIILGYHDDSVDIRFHKIRKEEPLWLVIANN